MNQSQLATIASSDFSLWSMFAHTDMVIKIVMLLLVMASLWSWTIIFEKFTLLKRIRTKIRRFEEVFWSGTPLDELFDKLEGRPRDPMSSIFVAALKEWRRSDISSSVALSLQQRIERVMQITLDREMGMAETRMTFLASTASVSPFLGLFGTVWGVMNSFHAIGISGNTSLAIVAPGIGEALFTTALGLATAIPAVVAYNKLSTDIDRLMRRLENFSGELSAILSRQIDSSNP